MRLERLPLYGQGDVEVVQLNERDPEETAAHLVDREQDAHFLQHVVRP